MNDVPRDRLRELLDAVLADDAHDLGDIASLAHSSTFHLSRQVSSATGEPPVARRRRVLLERAAWQLQRGVSVTDTAWEAGFESVDGFARAFSRAYGHPPSAMPPTTDRGHWLPAPNGIHFHGPTALYVDSHERHEGPSGDVLTLLVRHDLDDTAALLASAEGLDHGALTAVRLPGHRVLTWAGPEESAMDVLRQLALSKAPWLDAVQGHDATSPQEVDDVASLRERHDDVAARWLAWVRDVERRGAWGDRVIDALCDPPESFLLGQILAHDLTFCAHRRQLVRWMLRDAGLALDAEHLDPDPIMWHRRQSGERR